MKLKSYFSGTVEAAMQLARKELGEDALLVNARPSTPETRSLGAFEVVFGVVGAPAPASTASPGAAAPSTLASDVAELRREIEHMSRWIRESRLPTQAVVPYSETYAELLRAEVEPDLAAQVSNGVPLEDVISVDATLGRPGVERTIAVFVGPPGAGKTTTLVKLAANYGLASRRPAQIITTDVHRIAAADQLRHMAGILGIGCDVVETPIALAQALEVHRGKEYIFIDTPGLAAAEMDEGEELARLFSSQPEADIHLVVPASMRAADLSRVVDRYRIFQPHKLLFTRLDETGQFGPLLNESVRCSLPISFLTSGQEIPDDIEPATKEKLSALVRLGIAELMSKGAAA
jgi:flagellar biosynthesis protein FlhF